MNLEQAKVLVVGATGVLGSQLATELSRRGAQLVVTGRDADRLSAAVEGIATEGQLILDVVDVDACATVVAEAARLLGGLDAIVVAVGVAAFGPARDDSDVVIEELFATNALGPMALCRAALGQLGPGGCIAVLTAVLADVPTAQMAAYSASKAALSAYLTALRREVRRDKITVLDARPPHMETGLADRALAGVAPKMGAGHDIDEVIELIVNGIADGRSELVADLAAHTVTLR